SGAGKLIGPLIREDDALLAYLPLAHVLEFVVEHLCLWWGVPMGYGSIRTLTDSSVRNCQGDLRELRPTIMTGVPAVWESIRKGVITKVQEGGPTIQKMFKAALQRERRSDEELVAEEKHDLVAWVQVCELAPTGEYVPVQVLSQNTLDPGAFFLRQGLQRRIILTLTHNSGRQFPWSKIPKMEIGHSS
ncbi:16829_t:CDS:2, partial [Entrophospora sp. SA101]